MEGIMRIGVKETDYEKLIRFIRIRRGACVARKSLGPLRWVIRPSQGLYHYLKTFFLVLQSD
jgi:hypothetical protein